MIAYSSIIPPSSLSEVLRPLGKLSDEHFKAILGAVSGARSFSLRKDEIENLRNKLPPEAAKNITFLISALAFVYSHIARLTESKMPYREAIRGVVDELDENGASAEKELLVVRLADLLNPTIHEPLHKIQRLQAGFLPNAVGFSTLVDLRPDFGTGSELKLSGYIPVIQFRITTDATSPDERRIVFQVNENSLAELRKALERAEEKIKTLREKSAITSQIVKQP